MNVLFIEKAHEVGRVHQRLAALRSATIGATTDMVQSAGGNLLFEKINVIAGAKWGHDAEGRGPGDPADLPQIRHR